MKLRDRRSGVLAVMIAAFVSQAAAQSPLNPLVIRAPEQRGSVPPECAESLAPAPAPRVDVRQIPLPPEERPSAPAAPPRNALRAQLESVHAALLANDRPAFDAALASVRATVSDYPSGAERRAAEELVRTYDAAGRLWDAQYQSPFFAGDSPEYALVRGYPGWAEAVRRSTLTDRTGQRFYPAAESRDFLTRLAAERLRAIGVETLAPRTTARSDRPVDPGRTTTSGSTTSPRTTPSATTSTTTRPAATTRRSNAASGTASPRSDTSSARAPETRRQTPSRTTARRSTSTPRSSSPATTRTPSESRTPAAVTSAPGRSPNPSAPPTTAAAPAPAAPFSETATATAPPVAGGAPPDPAATSTATIGEDLPSVVPPLTDDTTAAPPATATEPAETTTTDAVQPESRTRSIWLPSILILIGLAVLIVLFRASK